MQDTTARDALERTIAGRLPACSHDELRVLDVVLSRLTSGREDYGPLDLSKDSRIFPNEAAEELTDCLFYLAADYVARRMEHRERMACEMSDLVGRGLDELRDVAPANDNAPGPLIEVDTGGEG